MSKPIDSVMSCAEFHHIIYDNMKEYYDILYVLKEQGYTWNSGHDPYYTQWDPLFNYLFIGDRGISRGRVETPHSKSRGDISAKEYIFIYKLLSQE